MSISLLYAYFYYWSKIPSVNEGTQITEKDERQPFDAAHVKQKQRKSNNCQ